MKLVRLGRTRVAGSAVAVLVVVLGAACGSDNQANTAEANSRGVAVTATTVVSDPPATGGSVPNGTEPPSSEPPASAPATTGPASSEPEATNPPPTDPPPATTAATAPVAGTAVLTDDAALVLEHRGVLVELGAVAETTLLPSTFSGEQVDGGEPRIAIGFEVFNKSNQDWRPGDPFKLIGRDGRALAASHMLDSDGEPLSLRMVAPGTAVAGTLFFPVSEPGNALADLTISVEPGNEVPLRAALDGSTGDQPTTWPHETATNGALVTRFIDLITITCTEKYDVTVRSATSALEYANAGFNLRRAELGNRWFIIEADAVVGDPESSLCFGANDPDMTPWRIVVDGRGTENVDLIHNAPSSPSIGTTITMAIIFEIPVDATKISFEGGDVPAETIAEWVIDLPRVAGG